MNKVIVSLLDSKGNVQYGLNWGQRENRDPNQAYLQLTPDIYKGDFFPEKGRYFIVETEDNKTLIMNRAQKDYGCAIQMPESNALLGEYLRNILGVESGAEITKDDIERAGISELYFTKVDNMHYKLCYHDIDFNLIAETDQKNLHQPLQQIFYGAPGTGKSFAIDNMADDDRTVRTTFHPDSDYASFVGAYKPTMEDVPINSIYGESVQFATGKNGHPGTERKIVYKYVPQAFLKAYVEAWKDLDNPHYLVIEEINRGNCAQIFGDLFQLLDRNAMGCSSYAIHADDDIRQFLASDKKGFAGLSEEQTEAIRSFILIKDNGTQKKIGEQILNGEQLLLPPNLYIWATMNTSDQSLFPIDSAFKRRWNWKFVPINYEQKDWLLHIGDSYYRWGDFLQQINPIIFSLTESSDKQMGYFFAKPDERIGSNARENNTISEDIFLNKVLFFIWTDILKDFDAGKEPFINPETGRAYEFSDFFKTDKNRVAEFIAKEQFGLEEVDVDDEPSNAEEEERQSKRSKYSSLTISFLDGSVIKEETIVATYLKAIEKIGIEKAAEVAASLKYKRRGHALITKEPVQELLDNNYTYATIGGYSVLKGIKTKSLVLLLRQINDVCNLGLNITLE